MLRRLSEVVVKDGYVKVTFLNSIEPRLMTLMAFFFCCFSGWLSAESMMVKTVLALSFALVREVRF